MGTAVFGFGVYPDILRPERVSVLLAELVFWPLGNPNGPFFYQSIR